MTNEATDQGMNPTERAASSSAGVRLVPTTAQFTIYSMYFASGAASLVCQVVWFKQLQFVLGSSTFSISVTVASFFLGLALGSWIGGQLADRWRYQLRAYGFMELGLAVVSLLVTVTLSHWQTWILWLLPLLGAESQLLGPVSVGISFLALLPPTLIMGVTLPLLGKHIVSQQDTLANKIGLLYGANTLGAAFGCAATGFYLIASHGVLLSAIFASCLYLAIGVTAVALSRTLNLASTLPTTETSVPEAVTIDSHVGVPAIKPRSVMALVMVFGASGFVSIAYEIIWFRLITNIGIHSVFAFSAMLTAYLVGLVLGSLICAWYLAPHKERHLLYYARLQFLIGIAAFVSLAMLGVARQIPQAFGRLLYGVPQLWLDGLGNVHGLMLGCFLVLLVPTALIGIGFPLASELTIPHLSTLGRRLGVLYALNTVAGVTGSLCAGFLLLPLFGSQWSLVLLCAMNFGLFAVVMLSQPSLRRQWIVWREAACAGVIIIVSLIVMGPDYLQKSLTGFNEGQTLAFAESTEGTIVVMEYSSVVTKRFQHMLYNGCSYASNYPPGRRYMATLAHLPALLHPEPRDAAVICIGTGTTIGALNTHPSIQQLHAVDLCPKVFDFAHLFVPINGRFHESPRVRKHVADGRHFLLTTKHRFDVLSFEPPPPDYAGTVNLYSREFYQLAASRLRPSGVIAQWIPLHLSRGELPKMMIRSLMEEFPHVSLWISNRMEGIAIASQEPLKIDLEVLRRKMRATRVKEDLQAVGFETPESLLATFVAADETLARFLGDAPSVTDDRPRIEYHNFYPVKRITYDEVLAAREPVTKYLTESPVNSELMGKELRIIEAIWREQEMTLDNRPVVTRQEIEECLGMAPNNAYLRYISAARDTWWRAR